MDSGGKVLTANHMHLRAVDPGIKADGHSVTVRDLEVAVGAMPTAWADFVEMVDTISDLANLVYVAGLASRHPDTGAGYIEVFTDHIFIPQKWDENSEPLTIPLPKAIRLMLD